MNEWDSRRLAEYLATGASPDECDFAVRHPRGQLENGGWFRKSESALAKLDETDAQLLEKEDEVGRVLEFLRNSKPVAVLTGDEFPPGGEKLTEAVPRFYMEHCGGYAMSPEFGKVSLDLEGVKSDLGHGMSRQKAIAFAAVPEIIQKGIVYNRHDNWKGRGWSSAVVGAPVRIGGDDYYCEVVIQRMPNRQGFYLHEVELKEKSEAAFKTSTKGRAAPASRLIIAKLAAGCNSEGGGGC